VSSPDSGTITFRARYSETDQMGVIYHTHYLVWCEMGRTDLMRQAGVAYSDVERGGLLLAVAEASVRYAAAARYDDEIRVTTRLAKVRSRALTFEYHIERVGPAPTVTLARAETVLVALDDNFTPRMLPGALLDRFRALSDHGA
jgi:acyl-CoA thioester hydrolase